MTLQRLRQRNRRLAFVVIVVCGVGMCPVEFCLQVRGQTWTRFRGPNGSGLSDARVPTDWNDDVFNWTTQLPGGGHSSPVIWDDRVFVTSADTEKATQYVLGIDTRDGRIVWNREFPLRRYTIHTRSSFALSTPAVDATHVYAAWSTPEEATLTALSHSGEVIWQRQLGPFANRHGFGSSPIVYQDLVVLALLEKKPDREAPRTQTSRIVALDRHTGEPRWARPLGTEVVSYSVPCIYKTPDGDDQLIGCSTADGIFALDPNNGELLWQIDVFEKRTISSPVLADGLIVGTTGSGGGGNYLVAVQPAPKPQRVYQITRQAPYVPTPIVKGGLLFLWSDKGIVSCHRASDGQRIWQERVGGNYSGSPVVGGENLYCIDDDGVVVVLAASETFQLLAKHPLGESSRSTPAIDGNRLYLRTFSKLFSVGRDD